MTQEHIDRPPTFRAVAHAALGGLQEVDEVVPAVAHRYGDAEEAAVLGAAQEELPCGAGRQLPHLAGPGQGPVLQGQPHRRLGTTPVHLGRGEGGVGGELGVVGVGM